MKKDLSWLKEEVDDLQIYSNPEVRVDSIDPYARYVEGVNDTVIRVKRLLDQLDKPEITLDRAFERVAESHPMTKEEILRHLERLVAYGGQVTYGEPEVLSQEWIRENQERKGIHFYVNAIKLQNLLVPKQEEVDQAYKDGYEKGKQYTFYKGYLEGLADKENEPETVADVISDFWKSFERLKEVMSMEVEELEE